MARKLTNEEIEALDWTKFDYEIAQSLADREFPTHPYGKGVSKSTVWKWRHQFGKASSTARRPNRKDRGDWDWNLSLSALSKLHGVSRQRVHQVKTALKISSRKSSTKRILNPRGKTTSDPDSSLGETSNGNQIQDPGEGTKTTEPQCVPTGDFTGDTVEGMILPPQ